MPPLLKLTGVRVAYGRGAFSRGENVAVRGADLEVGADEVVGLAGESGSGKSTVALAALGLLTPVAGRVEAMGTRWDRRSRRRLRADVQAVFQDPQGSLDPRQRVRSGLRELRRLHPERSGWIDDRDLLAMVELPPDILERYPHQLSGGQAQRVAIARALLLQPKVLVADEATASLDVSVQAQVVRVIQQLRAERGISVLMISHDLGVIRQTCDRVYVMYRGDIVDQGATEDVLTRPTHDYTRRLVASLPQNRLAEGGGEAR